MARKILLADDSVTAQNMGRRILGDAGYEVITVNNGSAALKKIAEFKPDVVILDVYMPGYGGLEVCVRIKEGAETSSIPVLITVGKMEPFKAEEAHKVRADAHMVKPFETNELLAAIAKLEDKIVPPRETLRGRSSKTSSEKKLISSRVAPNSTAGEEDRISAQALRAKPEPAKKSSKSKSSPEPEDAVPDAAVADTGFRDIGFRSLHRAEVSSESPSLDASADKQSFEASNAAEIETQPTTSDSSHFTSEHDAPHASEGTVETTQDSVAAADLPFAAQSNDAEGHGATFASGDAPQFEDVAKSVFESARTYHEDEVVAALASLVPTASGDEETSGHAPQQTPSNKSTGPRWVAESVPLSHDESAVILASEMEKAQAVAVNEEPQQVRIADLSADESQPESPAIRIESSGEGAESTLAAPESLDEIPSDIETPAAANIVEAISAGAMLQEEPGLESSASAKGNHEIALAAAAGTGSDSRSEDAASSQGMASAWANWSKIRESIVGTNLGADDGPLSAVEESNAAETPNHLSSSEVAPPGVSEFKDLRSEFPHHAVPVEKEAAIEKFDQVSEDRSTEISSIVDTMLAELKPKLMEEIARKMSKDVKKD